jgi:uncharacterized membrane protein YeiH
VQLTQILDVPIWANVTAIAVGSFQGAMYAAGYRKTGLDLLGIAVIGIATGLGGGFLRDILLNRFPIAMTANYYILIAVGAALLGMLLGQLAGKVDWLLTLMDALGLGLFAAIGTTAAMFDGVPVVPALFVGVITAVGGGVIRDLLLNTPISVMHVGSLYAVAAILGSGTLLVTYSLGGDPNVAAVLCIVVTTVVRMLAVRFGWSLPEQRILKSLRNPKLVTPDDLTGTIEIP